MAHRTYRADELKLPGSRETLLFCVESFANPARQEDWRTERIPYDSLGETWNMLGDQAVFDEDCRRLIGTSLRNEAEAEALNVLARALDALTDALGPMAEPEAYFAHPGWLAVREAAREAEKLLRQADY